MFVVRGIGGNGRAGEGGGGGTESTLLCCVAHFRQLSPFESYERLRLFYDRY